ncbi:hypothetical protein [Mesorhizobium sp.]|nr:MAG: hypothetical protein E5W95_31525 [Mesorhizobium sp.]
MRKPAYVWSPGRWAAGTHGG